MFKNLPVSCLSALLLAASCGKGHSGPANSAPPDAPSSDAPTANATSPAQTPASAPTPAPTKLPTPNQTQPETQVDPNAVKFDANLAREYQKLPPTVMIRVGSDGSAQDMRAPMNSEITDENGALNAFELGQGVTLAGNTSEPSTPSQAPTWAPYGTQTNFSSYSPQAYSQASLGVTYNYGYSAQFTVSGLTLYVYARPPCTPLYCQPSTYSNSGPASGVVTSVSAAPVPVSPVAPTAATTIDSQLAAAFTQYGVYAVTDSEYYTGNAEKIELGLRLFYDPILSSSKEVACASCHLAKHGTTTMTSLPPTGYVLSGHKVHGLGAGDLLGRNPPALFNLGHKSFTSMFWDSRVAASLAGVNGFVTPAAALTPPNLDNALAAQALFPIVTASEMAGCAAFVNNTQQSRPLTDIWNDIMGVVLAKQQYQAMFAAAFPEAGGVYGIQHLANALATFEAVTWRADGSPFDAYLRGDHSALSDHQKQGASYFYGKGKCATCHSGPFQTDHLHHAVAVPQFGPGEGDGSSSWEDYGYERVTGKQADLYKFKTPSLRNVALSGPWGHDGSFSSLREFVAHYSNPSAAFDHWNPKQVILPSGYPLDHRMLGAWADATSRRGIKAASEFAGNQLNSDEIAAITDFLTALTDKKAGQH